MPSKIFTQNFPKKVLTSISEGDILLSDISATDISINDISLHVTNEVNYG